MNRVLAKVSILCVDTEVSPPLWGRSINGRGVHMQRLSRRLRPNVHRLNALGRVLYYGPHAVKTQSVPYDLPPYRRATVVKGELNTHL